MSTGLINNAIDGTTDLIEKVSSPASRAGSTVERVGRMLEAQVSPEVIALQMTKNSANGNKYTVSDINSYGSLYKDAKKRSPITAAQTRALIKDQHSQRKTDDQVPNGYSV
ncbi:MAG: hypothetical protein JJK57_15770 [Komagataeibacter hansenii]|nr:hypothetical protein [Novacetimonas hansenii]